MKIRIYYEDTDAGGVVYHANYLKYLERGRTEFLRNYGFAQSYFLAENIAFVVKSVSIDYQSPARLDDEISVKTTVAKCKKASIIFTQEISLNNKTLVRASIIIVCVNSDTFLITPLPISLLTTLQKNNAL